MTRVDYHSSIDFEEMYNTAYILVYDTNTAE